VVNNDLPIRSVPDLIKYTKEAATPVTFASLGIGTSLHLAGEYMKLRYSAGQVGHADPQAWPGRLAINAESRNDSHSSWPDLFRPSRFLGRRALLIEIART
jgi:hypothetical protein